MKPRELDCPGYFLQFASDNSAGICPEALSAFNLANNGFAASYGNDDATHLVCDRLRELFEADAEIFLSSTARQPTRLRWPRCASPTRP